MSTSLKFPGDHPFQIWLFDEKKILILTMQQTLASNSNAPILLFLQHDVVDLYYLKLWILLYKNSQRFHHQRSTSFGCKEIEVYKIRDGDKCSNPNKSLHRKKLVLLRKYEKVFDADDIHGKRWNVVEMTFHIFLVKNSRNLKVCFNNCLPFSRVDFTMVY